MAISFELNAEARTDVGKGASRRLRREEKVPAVVYGAGKDAVSLTMQHNELMHALENEAFYSHILDLKVNGKGEQVILRDLQRHPSKPRILHADFQRVSASEKIHMHVPLHFIGEEVAPGVKIDGGIVSHLKNDVEITCLPKDLPEYIEVDISNLGLNESVHLSELKLAAGVEIPELALGEEHDHAVVSIHLPRAAKEAEETPEAEAAPEAEASAEKPAEGESKD
ncbi:MAG: 50S ribosomal protein L25/general stress protein Ctc [Gammaproteobacteria bacterium]|nr:50S ribosomal protein L25/general stress protein Ctc [Gammaproteobacteria bacterium]MDH5594092.1 50S ribosomal protein L25/general stress protein Ctc [Gammaproteobacteria bacterium]MDH5614191.1 50S ribosomal protein L25/general stress protein Ctc [Gammaproteobacteria bacterium]